MCSTFKALAVAAVMQRIDRGHDRADRRIAYGGRDLLAYAPVARKHLTRGWMTLAELCEAAMTVSDNTAANLLVHALGGPAGVTSFARSIGDAVTRLDRIEPALNYAPPYDPRDTTTPRAMAASLRAIALGDVLSRTARDRYVTLLRANQTGGARLRAGIPPRWTVGDKTGTGGDLNRFGDSETRNDVAIIWPPGRAPIVVTAYLMLTTRPAAQADAAIAAIGSLAAALPN
jgi:beta-lactamase class A